jgi:hypothetical protein
MQNGEETNIFYFCKNSLVYKLKDYLSKLYTDEIQKEKLFFYIALSN